jgi:UDP-N-acetylglucosamine 2-epimerase
VNVGTRQKGRFRAANVIDCGNGKEEVASAINQALDPAFRISLSGLNNPYYIGSAADVIVDRLSNIAIDKKLIFKIFVDLEAK